MPLWLLRLWLGPLPKEEIFPEMATNPLLRWVIHPIKRRVAKYYLLLLQRFFGLKVIAITGSAGKTTTKNLLFSILSAHKPTVASDSNTTSTFNIPTTILKATPLTKYLILEMSIEYQGDMEFYTWLAQPDIAIFLNANKTHTLFLDSPENVAAEKSKIFARMSPTSAAIINSDDPLIKPPINAKSYSFGSQPNSFCQILSSKLSNKLTTEMKFIINSTPISINLPLLGEHFAQNVAAALTTSTLLGIDYSTSISALEKQTSQDRRFNPVKLENESLLIDDSYNANPLAVSQSLNTLAKLAKLTASHPIFVFAQMNELGAYEKSAHEEVGKLLKKLEIKDVFCLGPATQFTIKSAGYGRYFKSQTDIIIPLRRLISQRKTIVLVKGSRSWHLEHLSAKIGNFPLPRV